MSAQRELRATPITRMVQRSRRTVRKPSVAGHRIASYFSPVCNEQNLIKKKMQNIKITLEEIISSTWKVHI